MWLQGVHLSGVVAGIAAVPAALAWFGRRVLPLPVELGLIHIAAAGFVVAAASSQALAKHTAWVLGKVRVGRGVLWLGVGLADL